MIHSQRTHVRYVCTPDREDGALVLDVANDERNFCKLSCKREFPGRFAEENAVGTRDVRHVETSVREGVRSLVGSSKDIIDRNLAQTRKSV